MKRHKQASLRRKALAAALFYGASILGPAFSWAGDKLINIQGKLTDNGGSPLSGTKVVTFRLYRTPTDPVSSALWTDNQSVTLQNGLFNIALGNATALDAIPFNTPYYLGMQVAGDDNELLPRQLLGASAYALGSLGDFHVKKQALFSNVMYPAPSISFTDDPDSGLAHPANDDLTIMTGGTARMRFDSAGYIGMTQPVSLGPAGTVPKQQLEVVGGISARSYYGAGPNGNDPAEFPKGSWHGGQALFSNTLYPTPAISFANDTDTGIAYTGTDDLSFMTGGSIQMRFDSGRFVYFNQPVGIGTAGNIMSEKLEVVGNIKCNNVYYTSDRRFKNNIQGVPNALDKVKHLRGVTYEWNQAEYEKASKPKGLSVKEEAEWNKTRHVHRGGRQLGVVAQEIEPIFPDLVSTDAAGYKAVDYSRLTVVLLEALKEQQKQIEALQAGLAAIRR